MRKQKFPIASFIAGQGKFATYYTAFAYLVDEI